MWMWMWMLRQDSYSWQAVGRKPLKRANKYTARI